MKKTNKRERRKNNNKLSLLLKWLQKMVAHTHYKRNNNAHITHLLKYNWVYKGNSKIPFNKLCQQISENKLILKGNQLDLSILIELKVSSYFTL